MKFIWPWQWKAIAEKTLEDLQKERGLRVAEQRKREATEAELQRIYERNRQLTEQVRSMSQR